MKPFRKILVDATVTAVSGALLAGLSFWALSEWVDYYTPMAGPVVVTDDAYVIIGTAGTSGNLDHPRPPPH